MYLFVFSANRHRLPKNTFGQNGLKKSFLGKEKISILSEIINLYLRMVAKANTILKSQIVTLLEYLSREFVLLVITVG